MCGNPQSKAEESHTFPCTLIGFRRRTYAPSPEMIPLSLSFIWDGASSEKAEAPTQCNLLLSTRNLWHWPSEWGEEGRLKQPIWIDERSLGTQTVGVSTPYPCAASVRTRPHVRTPHSGASSLVGANQSPGDRALQEESSTGHRAHA